MSNAQKIVLPVLLLAAAAGGVFYVLNQGGPVEPPKPVAPIVEPGPKVTPAPDGPVVQAPPVERTPDPVRVEAPMHDGNAHDDAPQGVKGRVVLPNGAPAPGIPLYLMENSMNDPIKVFLQNKTGARTPPISSGKTAADGTFALGVLKAGKAYDLRVVSEGHPEINHQSIKVRDEDWYDTGDLRLELGVVVSGRVIEEGTKAPVRDAAVFLANSNQAHAIVATPGRERGVVATTDAQGNFRFGNAPRQGFVNLAAEANGYASALLQNQPLQPDGTNEFVLEVARGLPIGGIVVDGAGKPLPGISITASGLSAKTPQTATTTSSSQGTFEFANLREGPYQLATSSPQFVDVKSPPVMTGELDVKLVMAQRAFVKLRVLAANQAPIKAYGISLKRTFPNNPVGVGNVVYNVPSIGNVPEFADRRITPADHPAEFAGEWAVVRGVPVGEYVFQIQEATHAMTLSPSFTVVDGGPPPEVEATLTLGASITGTVIDDHGKPVVDAVVSTDMNGGFDGDSDFGRLLRGFVPERHSRAQVRTDAQGRFRMGKLAFADYMVRVAHRDFCEGTAVDVKLESEGQVVDIGVIQLARGTIVEGVTSVGGMPVGQIKVTVTVPQPEGVPAVEGQPQKVARMPFSTSAISDNDGRFVLLKRVPPGSYKAFACRESGDNNPFLKILDMKETERKVDIAPGQDRLQLDFNLPKR
ncbi:MAG: carboxypeptidase-like regulatory domain-containing protein [Planctomycetota bacterium]|nr:carboxypeptidase-like regulatory domain-containing protein [Planctomycetota bacterium]